MKKLSILETYEKNAEYFLKTRGQHLMEKKYLDQMMSHLKSGDTVLDVGCGTGKPMAEYLIKNGFHVFGVDGAINMIKLAKENLPQETWQVHDMRTLKLNQKFPALMAWHSFFHLTQDEQKKMFSIFKSHLKPNGILMFTSGTENGEAYGAINGDELYHSSFSIQEYREILKSHRFEVLDFHESDPSCGGATVWTARLSE